MRSCLFTQFKKSHDLTDYYFCLLRRIDRILHFFLMNLIRSSFTILRLNLNPFGELRSTKMQISPISTLSEEINDIRLRTADIVANRIIPNEGVIYAGGDKSKKLRKEINEEVKKQGLWAPHLPQEYGGMGNGFLVHAYMNEILAWSP